MSSSVVPSHSGYRSVEPNSLAMRSFPELPTSMSEIFEKPKCWTKWKGPVNVRHGESDRIQRKNSRALWSGQSEQASASDQNARQTQTRSVFREAIRQLRMTGSNTPKPKMNSHTAGAGVPAGRVCRASLAAIRGSSMSHAVWRRSSARNVTAVAAP